MSILSSLYHGEIHNKPNDVHNVPVDAKQTAGNQNWIDVPLAGTDSPPAQADGKSTDGSGVLPAHAKRRIHALREGHLRPPLYYTGQEQTPCANGVWESPHTVASKLESKEEFPQG